MHFEDNTKSVDKYIGNQNNTVLKSDYKPPQCSSCRILALSRSPAISNHRPKGCFLICFKMKGLFGIIIKNLQKRQGNCY